MQRAKITGVDWYRWVDPDDPAQIHEVERGKTIEVTDTELARGVAMGALEPASATAKVAAKVRKPRKKKPASATATTPPSTPPPPAAPPAPDAKP